MEANRNAAGWVYVVVSPQGESGHFLGLYDKEKDVHFIPAFPNKDAAEEAFLNLPRQKGKKYEIQAIHMEELTADADKNGFAVVLIDGDGSVIA